MGKRVRVGVALVVAAFAVVALPLASVAAETGDAKTYVVVFKDDAGLTGDGTAVGAFGVAQEAAGSLVEQAGGTITSNLVREIGVAVVRSPNELFDETMRAQTLVQEAGEDYVWEGVPTAAQLSSSEDEVGPCLGISNAPECPGGTLSEEAFEDLQWDMQQICAVESDDARWTALCGEGAHAVEKGDQAVDVGILDTGIDGGPEGHFDLQANVDCARGRDSIAETQTLPADPGVGLPDPCEDNGFHGTHVAGTVAADDNGFGMVGVAPDVTMVPVKVCDATTHWYASAVIDGITYSGHQKFDVINMSFFVDDDSFLQSTQYKCSSDPVQRTIRHAVERAIQFARRNGVTPVAALGNSDVDLARPPEPYENECDVVPAETQGVVGTMALGRNSQKASYSNYGSGMTDVAAPGGSGTTGNCLQTILSTFPKNTYACIQGTSMASPHTSGVAALVVSRYGRPTVDTNDPATDMDDTAPPVDYEMPPQKVEDYIQSTTIDLVNELGPAATKTLRGYDECFGNGRIDARRAVLRETAAIQEVVPVCAEGQD